MIVAIEKETKRKIFASKEKHALCPCCSSLLIPKCGDIRINHWAHYPGNTCIMDGYFDNLESYLWKSKQDPNICENIHNNEIVDIIGKDGWKIMIYKGENEDNITNRCKNLKEKVLWIVDGTEYGFLGKDEKIDVEREEYVWPKPKYALINNMKGSIYILIDYSNVEDKGLLFSIKRFNVYSKTIVGRWIRYRTLLNHYIYKNELF
jgi:hypothetical protein